MIKKVVIRRKFLAIVCVTLLLLSDVLIAQSVQKSNPPEKSRGPGMLKTVGEITAGTVGSITGLACGGVVGLLFLSSKDPQNIGELIGESVMALLLAGVIGLGGSILGSATGVYIVGNLGDSAGSFWSSLLGSTLGTVLGAAGIAMIGEKGSDGLKFSVFVLSQSIGATALFNLTAKREHRYGALFNFDNEGFNLGLPEIHIRLDDTSNYLAYRTGVEILRYKF
ncbi:hypothetical protein KAW65_02950 [candidate division WOR-3 bacterium]|nr:hypothetical protein [candidate division WOR-3 bacterium]